MIQPSARERGYTLIEVLIASSLFVGILVIATATFATANRIRERTIAITLITETARSVTESITRDLRSATGIRSLNGSFRSGLEPFSLVGADPNCATGARTGTTLRAIRFEGDVGDNGQTVVHDYFVETAVDGTAMLKVLARTYGGTPVTLADPHEQITTSLLPDGVGLASGGFAIEGVTHEPSCGQSPAVQPFAQLKLGLNHVGDARNADVGLATQTSVTSREYFE